MEIQSGVQKAHHKLDGVDQKVEQLEDRRVLNELDALLGNSGLNEISALLTHSAASSSPPSSAATVHVVKRFSFATERLLLAGCANCERQSRLEGQLKELALKQTASATSDWALAIGGLHSANWLACVGFAFESRLNRVLFACEWRLNSD